jgi:alpha/beta superfamily hydrolase
VISEEVTIETSDEIALEGVLESEGPTAASLIICHPHPQMGGTMNAPLLLALRDVLVARRWAVLRFNFRGIGKSGGESGTGEAEIEDVRACVRLIRQRSPEQLLALTGWSFGAAVAIRVACADDSLAACVAIAPPVSAKPGVTAGIPAPGNCKITCPLLVITGANDDQVSPSECRTWSEAIAPARYVEVPGANHFFWAKYETLASKVAGFLDEIITKEA